MDRIKRITSMLCLAKLIIFGPASAIAYSNELDCSHFQPSSNKRISYRLRDNGPRCEGYLTDNKSHTRRGGPIHLRSLVIGDIKLSDRTTVNPKSRLKIEVIGDLGPKDAVQIIAQSTPDSRRYYRLETFLEDEKEFTWGRELIDEKGLNPEVLMVFGRIKTRLNYKYVPVMFYEDEPPKNIGTLNVKFISDSQLGYIDIKPECKESAENGKQQSIEFDSVKKNKPIQIEIDSRNCTTKRLIVTSDQAVQEFQIVQ